MKKILERIAPYRKAVAALLAPAAVVLAAALLPGSDGGSAITSAELGTAVTAALGAAGVVYKVRNGHLSVDVDLEKAEAAAHTITVLVGERGREIPPAARNSRKD